MGTPAHEFDHGGLADARVAAGDENGLSTHIPGLPVRAFHAGQDSAWGAAWSIVAIVNSEGQTVVEYEAMYYQETTAAAAVAAVN